MAPKKKHNIPPELKLGPLPVEMVFRTLQLDLDAGEVVFSGAAQIHASNRHPEDYAACLPYAGAIVTNPLYIGEDAKNPGKIEFIARPATYAQGILVAVVIEPDGNGNYHVASIYPLGAKKIENRRRSGYLKPAK